MNGDKDMNLKNRRRGVVLLSGGLDSATVLMMAKAEGYALYALSVDYGQRHKSELAAARNIARREQLVDHKIVSVDMTAFGGSALTQESINVPERMATGIPVTYVPARNTVMLSLAMAYAETIGSQDIFIGANAVDYSGYPDCRPEFIEAFEAMANLATKAAIEGKRTTVHAPLIDFSKAKIIQTGSRLGMDYALTVSCYQADEHGAACGVCDSCRLRRQGFKDAGIEDPTRYQLQE